MSPAEVQRIYDRDYAALYNQSFLLGPNFIECTTYELSLVREFLKGRHSWLDVACGTGYLLSQLPEIKRSGLDISPAMLSVARLANSGAEFVESDFRAPQLQWTNKWELVSCTWYAYCYADTIADVRSIIKNLAAWTSPEGICFVPLCDPNVLCKVQIPQKPPADSDDGRLEVLGVVWQWTDEPLGREHRDLIAPHLAWMEQEFLQYFSDVKVCKYPKFKADCLASRQALVASGKR